MDAHEVRRALTVWTIPSLLALVVLTPWNTRAQLKCPGDKMLVAGKCLAPAAARALETTGKPVQRKKPPPRTSPYVVIKGGSFMMGSNMESDEKPIHRVSIRTFEMTRTEVTTAQYRRCVGAGACRAAEWAEEDADRNLTTGTDGHYEGFCDASQPVVGVTHRDARKFCRWAGGWLPSEAQWEYAARSGPGGRRFPWGNETPSCARAVMGHPRTCSAADPCGCGRNGTWPVCSKVAGNTTHGLCDMAGNVFEWLADCWMGSYHGAPADGSAWQQEPCRRRFMRGGGWGARADSLRAAYRYPYPPARKYQKNYGFRCARPRR